MKATVTATMLAFWLLAICLIATSAYAAATLMLSPSQGGVGKMVILSTMVSYGTGSYQLYWDEDKQLLAEGDIHESSISLTFNVPETTRGIHIVRMKIGDDNIDGEFTVVPTIALNTVQGTTDSDVTVAGKGFDSNETGIQIIYDGTPVASGIEANDKGSWQGAFKIPASKQGMHTVDAQGGTTPATDVSNVTFTVMPKITLNPTAGWVGTTISIFGSGFASGETHIEVTYDSSTLKTAVTADNNGSWQSSFSVPSSVKGDHEVKASGTYAAESDTAVTSFTVSPAIKLELLSGHLGGAIHVGDSLMVSGVGFEANENKITVTCDGNQVLSDIVADAKGSWSDTLAIPPLATGEHIIDASGRVTKASDIVDSAVIVSPKIEINPNTAAAVGAPVTVSGTGFAGDNAVTVNFDGTKVASDVITGAKGSFESTFDIPKSTAGDHLMTAVDGKGSVVSATINIESVAPPTPELVSPEPDSKLGLVGNTVVTFKWSNVEDPSGVSYVLEISPGADFATTVLRKEGLTTPEYTLTKDEALAKEDYYWRVRAVDGADNQGDWTDGRLLKINNIAWWIVIVVVLAVIIIVVVVTRFVRVSRRDEWQ